MAFWLDVQAVPERVRRTGTPEFSGIVISDVQEIFAL